MSVYSGCFHWGGGGVIAHPTVCVDTEAESIPQEPF